MLDDFDEIRICIGYEHDGKRLKTFPTDVQTLSAKPVYETRRMEELIVGHASRQPSGERAGISDTLSRLINVPVSSFRSAPPHQTIVLS
jgi:adenylosuccinate synthase